MSNQLIMREHAARAGMGTLNAAQKAAGMYEDGDGNTYWADGTYAFGRLALESTRPRYADPPALATTQPRVVALPNGQQVTMTAAQFQQYVAAQQAAAPGSQISAGLGAGFDSFAKQFGVSSTTLILLAVAGVYLLMKPPPERKR